MSAIEWQHVALLLASSLSSWAIWEVKRLHKAIDANRQSLFELREALHPLIADIAYLKGYLAGKKETQ